MQAGLTSATATRGTGNTCQAGQDLLFTGNSHIIVNISDTSHTFSHLTICSDTVDESDETFTLTWVSASGDPFNGGASNCSSNSQCTITVTINDDDPTVALGPDDSTANGFDLSSRSTNVGGGVA